MGRDERRGTREEVGGKMEQNRGRDVGSPERVGSRGEIKEEKERGTENESGTRLGGGGI